MIRKPSRPRIERTLPAMNMPKATPDLRGQLFGSLLVPLDAVPEMRDHHAYWPVICQNDPTRKWVRGRKLLDGTTVSCGCERADPYIRLQARHKYEPEEDHSDDMLDDWERGKYEAEMMECEPVRAHRDLAGEAAEDRKEQDDPDGLITDAGAEQPEAATEDASTEGVPEDQQETPAQTLEEDDDWL